MSMHNAYTKQLYPLICFPLWEEAVRQDSEGGQHNVNAFERLLGPCMDVMKDRVDDYEDQLIRIFGSKANISDIR